jgi:8-oxo-dGTP pyrophosphatase MutT (NUDIX family)
VYEDYRLPISVKLAIDFHGRIPLLCNERDEWELPGGKLERGESPEYAVVREVAEELGLTIEGGVSILDTWVYEITSATHVFIVSYGAVYAGTETPALSQEHKQLGLFGYDEVPSLPMPYKATIARWRSHLVVRP